MKDYTLKKKEAVVDSIKEKLEASQSVVLIDYRGLTVAEVTELRNQMREAGVEYQVLKNTMIKRAAEKAGIEGLDPILEGPTAVAFGINDPVAPAKILTKFAKDTKKITNAMYLIASTKLRKAKNSLERTRPYFEALQGEIKRIFRTAGDVDNRYFYPPEGAPPLDGTYGCLVITADKGLAGAYNQNVIKEAQRMLHEHPDTKLFVVGEYGRHFFAQHGIPIERSFLYTAQNPTMDRAREISAILLDGFDRGELEKIFVIYTDMENSLTSAAHCTRLCRFTARILRRRRWKRP